MQSHGNYIEVKYLGVLKGDFYGFGSIGCPKDAQLAKTVGCTVSACMSYQSKLSGYIVARRTGPQALVLASRASGCLFGHTNP